MKYFFYIELLLAKLLLSLIYNGNFCACELKLCTETSRLSISTYLTRTTLSFDFIYKNYDETSSFDISCDFKRIDAFADSLNFTGYFIKSFRIYYDHNIIMKRLDLSAVSTLRIIEQFDFRISNLSTLR